MNCRDCSFREWDGKDNVCTAHFDGLPGHPHVELAAEYHPQWCPLDQPKRITEEEILSTLPPTVAVAIANMYRANGDPVPSRLIVRAGERELNRSDRE